MYSYSTLPFAPFVKSLMHYIIKRHFTQQNAFVRY